MVEIPLINGTNTASERESVYYGRNTSALNSVFWKFTCWLHARRLRDIYTFF